MSTQTHFILPISIPSLIAPFSVEYPIFSGSIALGNDYQISSSNCSVVFESSWNLPSGVNWTYEVIDKVSGGLGLSDSAGPRSFSALVPDYNFQGSIPNVGYGSVISFRATSNGYSGFTVPASVFTLVFEPA